MKNGPNAGKRCTLWAVYARGLDKCAAHAGIAPVAADPAYGQRLRAEKARQQAEERERRAELRKLGIRAQVRHRIEDRSIEIVDTLMKLAQHEDPQVALRAIDALWNRSYGRPVTPTLNVNADLPEMPRSIEEIKQMSPEERRLRLLQIAQNEQNDD